VPCIGRRDDEGVCRSLRGTAASELQLQLVCALAGLKANSRPITGRLKRLLISGTVPRGTATARRRLWNGGRQHGDRVAEATPNEDPAPHLRLPLRPHRLPRWRSQRFPAPRRPADADLEGTGGTPCDPQPPECVSNEDCSALDSELYGTCGNPHVSIGSYCRGQGVIILVIASAQELVVEVRNGFVVSTPDSEAIAI
jgi:hypothetical protein